MRFSSVVLASLLLGPLGLGGGVSAASLTVDLNRASAVGGISDKVPTSFISVMVEWQRIRDIFSTKQQNLVTWNSMYFRDEFLNMLNLPGSLLGMDRSSMYMRVGGNSADDIWFTLSTLAKDNKMITPIEKSDLQMLNDACKVTGLKYILTIGMRIVNPAHSMDLTQAFKQYISDDCIYAIEIGNEPDHLEKRGERPAGYSYPTFLSEYRTFVAAVRQIFPNKPLMGPSYAYGWREAGYMTQFIQDEAASTKLMSFHRYELKGCANFNSLETLLDSPTVGEYQWISEMSALAKSSGNELVWGEGSTASCGGVDGISNVFGSGLWGLDAMLEFAWRGVTLSILSGTPQALYAPITVNASKMVVVNPIYYAMLMFNIALEGPNTRVYAPKSTGTTLRLKTWAMFNEDTGDYTLIILHKGYSDPATVTVTSPLQGAKAQSIVMKAPSMTSTSGHTIGDMKVDPVKGLFDRGPNIQQHVPNAQGAVQVTVAPGSAMIVRFSNSPASMIKATPNPRVDEIINRQKNGSLPRSGVTAVAFNVVSFVALLVVLM